MITPATPEQPALFHEPTTATARPEPTARAGLTPTLRDGAEALLHEINHDWWSLLDLRNWREPGPTDTEILARYRAADTQSHGDWPNISGHRMYDIVWPALRLTHHISEDVVLLTCQRTLKTHLRQAIDDQRANALRYSIADDLLDRHTWNGETLRMYHALCRFAGTDRAPFPVLIREALTLRRLTLAASLLEAKAQQLRLTARPSLHKHEKDSLAFLTAQLSAYRTALAECTQASRAENSGRFFLERATIGPRFEDPRWPTLQTGDPLPPGLIDMILGPTTSASDPYQQLAI